MKRHLHAGHAMVVLVEMQMLVMLLAVVCHAHGHCAMAKVLAVHLHNATR